VTSAGLLDPTSPVLVGLGATQQSASVVDLMTEAVRLSAADAGATGLLTSLDRIVVPQGSWALSDPGRSVALRVGAGDARSVLAEVGVSQQEVINHALAAIASGDCGVVAVVGAEARAWERQGGTETDQSSGPPDEILTRPPDFIAPVEIAAGLVWPVVQQYALIENALAAAERLSGEAQRDQIAALWHRFNEVATQSRDSAFGTPRTAEEIATPGPRNRPLAFPYNLRHSTQWTVDQGSALLICSVARATEAGVPTDRWLFPHVALHCSEAVTLTARRHLHAWPGMGVLGRAAEAHLGVRLRDLSLAEVYSCFPAAVRVQQRELDLDPSGTPTLTGGMAFAGGPFNHYVLQSVVALGRRLRDEPTALGLVTTVSGMLSKPGLAVWSASPPNGAPLRADLATEARAATEVLPVVASPPETESPANVASFTVTYGGDDGLEPTRTAIVADLADGVRTAATCEDAVTARLAVAEGPAWSTRRSPHGCPVCAGWPGWPCSSPR
jgi:acetyl-CoA C-acetyltransferase